MPAVEYTPEVYNVNVRWPVDKYVSIFNWISQKDENNDEGEDATVSGDEKDDEKEIDKKITTRNRNDDVARDIDDYPSYDDDDDAESTSSPETEYTDGVVSNWSKKDENNDEEEDATVSGDEKDDEKEVDKKITTRNRNDDIATEIDDDDYPSYDDDDDAESTSSPETLLTVYKAQIRPSLEYCSHIWGAAAPTTLSILDAVQRRAIRLLGDPALTCHLQPLSHRRGVGHLSLFYQYSNGFCSSIIPPLSKPARCTSGTSSSHPRAVVLHTLRTERYDRTFAPRCPGPGMYCPVVASEEKYFQVPLA
nr:unnamed protein product [Callosobruchus chinensis]